MRPVDADGLLANLSKLLPAKMPMDYDEDDNDLGAILWEVKKIIDKEPTVNQWIPCSEGMPGYETFVFATMTDESVARLKLKKENDCIYWTGDGFDYNLGMVTAWMPAPEPYKGE